MSDNGLPNDADRYTVIICGSTDEFAKKIHACAELGLEWFARPMRKLVGMMRIEMHIFFDNAGARNYLAGLYDEPEANEEAA